MGDDPVTDDVAKRAENAIAQMRAWDAWSRHEGQSPGPLSWKDYADALEAALKEKDEEIARLRDNAWPRPCNCDAPENCTEEVDICGGCGGYRT